MLEAAARSRPPATRRAYLLSATSSTPRRLPDVARPAVSNAWGRGLRGDSQWTADGKGLPLPPPTSARPPSLARTRVEGQGRALRLEGSVGGEAQLRSRLGAGRAARASAGCGAAPQWGVGPREGSLKEPAWRCHCSVSGWSCWQAAPMQLLAVQSSFLVFGDFVSREKSNTDNIRIQKF